MKKSIWFSTIIVLSAVILYSEKSKNPTPDSLRLLNSPLVSKVDRIDLTSGLSVHFSFFRDGSQWYLDKKGMKIAAKNTKIVNAIKTISSLKMVKEIPSTEYFRSSIKEYSTKIELFNDKESISILYLGMPRSGGGQYILDDKEKRVFLSSRTLLIEATEEEWIN